MTTRTATQSLLDNEPLFSAIKGMIVDEGETNASIARRVTEEFDFPTTDDSIRRFRKRHKLGVPTVDKASVKVEGDLATLVSPPISVEKRDYKNLDDPDAMLRERGLDPEEWAIDGATVNEWEAPLGKGTKTTYHQAKLVLKRKKPEHSILPARTEGWVAPDPRPRNKATKLVVVFGDMQYPFHDPHLHDIFCQWLRDNQPDEVIGLGDTVDLPEISRHRLDPENTSSTQECVNVGYKHLRQIRDAVPNSNITILPGNHDERLRNILLDNADVRPLYGLSRALEEEPVLAVPYLLRFDELKINYVDPKGSYEHAQINVNDKLAVRHGWIARKGSGASALATLEHLGYSVIVGHTHRQSIVYKTTHDIDGTPTTLTAAEAGCMCRVNQRPLDGRRWPSYTPLPDWTQGFTTVNIWEDGKFRIDNATYVNNTLLWRDQRYL